MSRSFIAIKTVTYSGKQYVAELDSGDTAIDVEVHNGTFMLNKRDFESIKTISELFKIVYDWFYESMEDPACTIDEVDEALNIYGSGNFTEIRSSQKEDVHFIAVFSRIEYLDEPYGASLIVYDFESKSLVEEHRDEFPYSDMEDCYGDDLYEQFLSESFNSVPPDTASNENFESTIQTYDLSIGDSITIDGLTWTVIAIEGSKALILADKTVGKQHYNRKCKEVTWETCTLRKWLNEDYYDSLSAAAKNIILEVENDNPANPISGVSGGAKTKDRIFVLSLDEVNEYLPDISGRSIGDYWRTRTPGAELRQALVFEPNGQILDDEECWVEFKYGIRPAAWIKIN